ncbi:histidinol-phosphate aminotransferase [Armillaria mellea]|nr:histidinol-phosphate aminotransferase [Armillaria mellea]
MPILGLPESFKSTGPAHFDIEKVIRPNILSLHPYRCARDDYKEGILLDANENALGHSILPPADASEINDTLELNLHRYPDPSHDPIKERIAALRSITGVDHVFLGVGSDEVIDLLMRVCVAPEREKILITPPTYGMYAVCAQVNDVGIVKVPLELSGAQGEGGTSGRFSIRLDEIKKAVNMDPSIKLIFLCSPGNPTGTLIPLSSIHEILDHPGFKGIVIVDEAYIDFAGAGASAVSLVREYANLCVMQTVSKSFGLAAIRLGIAIAQPPLIQILSNTKAPYNISTPTAHLAFCRRDAIQNKYPHLLRGLNCSNRCGNDANFIVVPVLTKDGTKPDNVRSQKVYKSLAEENGVVVRFRGNEPGCEGCLRITVGSEEENDVVVRKLTEVLRQL